MQEHEVRARLREWIAKHAKKPLTADFSDQTPVLEEGFLSSLDVVEFVLYIEDLRGNEVDADAIEPEAFTNIDTLYAAFFRSP